MIHGSLLRRTYPPRANETGWHIEARYKGEWLQVPHPFRTFARAWTVMNLLVKKRGEAFSDYRCVKPCHSEEVDHVEVA